MPRQQRGVERDDRGVLLLAAEPAAGLGLDDAGLPVVEGQRRASARCGRSTGTGASRGRSPRRRRPGTAIIALFSMYSCSWWPTRYSPSKTRSAAAKRGVEVAAAELVVARRRGRTRAGRRPAGAARSERGWRGGRPAASPGRGRRGARAARRGGGSRRPIGTRIGWSALIEADDVVAGDVGRGHDDDRRPVERRGRARARRTCAWASVERIVAPYQAPGKTRSSAYFAAPVSLAGPSRRSGGNAARPTGRDRPRFDDDGAGRLGPRRQVGHGPSFMATDSITGSGAERPISGGRRP